MELKKVSEEIPDIIEGAGSLGMPGELRALPGGQFAVEGVFDLGQFHPQFADFILGGRFSRRSGCELFDLFFDLADRFFELEVIAHIVAYRYLFWGREYKYPTMNNGLRYQINGPFA